MSFLLIEGTVYQEVFDRFHCYALTIGTNWHVGFANSKEVVVEADVPCAELEENRCLASIEIGYEA